MSLVPRHLMLVLRGKTSSKRKTKSVDTSVDISSVDYLHKIENVY